MQYDVDSLENAIKKFVKDLPYWAKFLSAKALSGNTISDTDIDFAYSYLLQELGLEDKALNPEIKIAHYSETGNNYKTDLSLMKIEKVEGVNALAADQTIEFNPQLTIIYGTNGSGKSGYIRLLKQAFHSKAPEEILPNIHSANKSNPTVSAKFTFTSNDKEIPLTFDEKDKAEFSQFSVFDGKGLLQQLSEKNEFEFRPAGLSFFSYFAEAVKCVEQKLNNEIKTKQSPNDFVLWFDGDSEIKAIVKNLSGKTKIEDLEKYTPFTDQDKISKEAKLKQCDELALAIANKEKEIKRLRNIKKLFIASLKDIDALNRYFATNCLNKVRNSVEDYLSKESLAKSEGIEKFNTTKIEGIGTKEWKDFILSAKAFADIQKTNGGVYPENSEYCLFCHQPILGQENLIKNYWIYIKSVAEENASKAKDTLNKIQKAYENLDFNIFPKDNVLTNYLLEKHRDIMDGLQKALTEQKQLSKSLISDIINVKACSRSEIIVCIQEYKEIETSINNSISILQNGEQTKEQEKLNQEKVFLEHKEKLNMHLSKFKDYIINLAWVDKARKASFAKRKITETEKKLSARFFNQRYIDIFNSECERLNGNFGIEINHTGSAGKSYRQLKLKGKNPNIVLSEGEQKVIAIADFIAEMQVSEVNRGIIFDDPVTSLDDIRKSEIAKRLVEEGLSKQTVVFTHDLAFVSSLIGHSTDKQVSYNCHWIEKRNDKPGVIWLNNSPSYEREYRNGEPARNCHAKANKSDCSPQIREYWVRSGFTALRTCYEVLVINDLFKNVVQRFNERVSIDSLGSIYFDTELIQEITDSFAQCCRYMEGHSHSDKYAYIKPTPANLLEEIERYDSLRKKIKKIKKPESTSVI